MNIFVANKAYKTFKNKINNTPMPKYKEFYALIKHNSLSNNNYPQIKT